MRGRCTAILKARHYTHKCTLHSLRSGDKAHKHFTFGPVHSVWGKFARNFLALTGNFGKTFYTLLYLKSENAIFLSQVHHIPGKINTLSFTGIHSAQMALPLITWLHTLQTWLYRDRHRQAAQASKHTHAHIHKRTRKYTKGVINDFGFSKVQKTYHVPDKVGV